MIALCLSVEGATTPVQFQCHQRNRRGVSVQVKCCNAIVGSVGARKDRQNLQEGSRGSLYINCAPGTRWIYNL